MEILAVDDERIALMGLVRIIKKIAPDASVNGFQSAREALAYAKEHPIDIAFLDIEMRGKSGMDLAHDLKELYPEVNLVFTTGYMDYAPQAFDLHASGYVMKPVTEEKIKKEMEELRHPLEVGKDEVPAIYVRAFGNFEIYIHGKPVRFQYNKTKEFFAYLIDRNGSLCRNNEILAALWEGEMDEKKHISYLKNIRTDLLSVLEENGLADIIVRTRGGIGVLPEKIPCDYYEYLRSDNPSPRAQYRGEYMTQYSWAEFTNGILQMKMMNYD